MKKIIIILSLMFSVMKAHSQTIVVDPLLIEVLIATHTMAYMTWQDIKDEEKDIKKQQATTLGMLELIRQNEQKVYDYLSTVQDVVKNGKDIIYATEIAMDIRKNLQKIKNIAASDPELLIVASKTENLLIRRTLDLTLYITDLAKKGGENNLLDNKQRIDCAIHVVNELTIMRALTLKIIGPMETAKREGIIKTLVPEQFQYVQMTQQQIDDILKN